MSETAQLLELLQQQHKEQMTILQEQNKALVAALTTASQPKDSGLTTASQPKDSGMIPKFTPFNTTEELWGDYWDRFCTFIQVHSIPEAKQAQVFLTNQTSVLYKLISSYASQLSPSKEVNQLMLKEIQVYMKEQFDPTIYVVRERYKFWSDMKRKPGETVHELAARIRQDAVMCDFTSIADPLDEALRTCFICSISNEAVLKATFKIKDTDLTFAKAIAVANETEDAARVAKETVHGVKNTEIHKINTNAPRGSTSKSPRTNAPSSSSPFPKGTCGRCGGDNHIGKNWPYINTTCNYCKKKGHLESVCLQKNMGKSRKHVKIIHLDTVKMVNAIPQITQAVNIKGHTFTFEVHTGAGDNFCSTHFWNQLGKPSLSATKSRYESATGGSLPVTGTR